MHALLFRTMRLHELCTAPCLPDFQTFGMCGGAQWFSWLFLLRQLVSPRDGAGSRPTAALAMQSYEVLPRWGAGVAGSAIY